MSDNIPEREWERLLDRVSLETIEVVVNRRYYDPEEERWYTQYVCYAIPLHGEEALGQVLSDDLNESVHSLVNHYKRQVDAMHVRRKTHLEDVFHYLNVQDTSQ